MREGGLNLHLGPFPDHRPDSGGQAKKAGTIPELRAEPTVLCARLCSCQIGGGRGVCGGGSTVTRRSVSCMQGTVALCPGCSQMK